MAMMTAFSGGGDERRIHNWSELLPELLALISNYLSDIGDHVRFRVVCKSWRSAAATPTNLLPWLLLPYTFSDPLRRFYSLSSKRIYRFRLLAACGRAIYTSPHGWLLMAAPNLSLSLFHPFTHSQIDLPPVSTTSPIYRTFRGLHRRLQITQLPTTFRCYPFISPAGEHIVALVIAGTPQFMYCRLQHDNVWIKQDPPASPDFISTIAYHKGRFYILHEKGDVAVCDLNADAKPALVKSLKVPAPTPGLSSCYFGALDGKLLLVASVSNNSEEMMMEGLTLFKMQDEGGELKWSKIKGIGDHALFLTLKENVIVAAATAGDAYGCKRNHVYYNVSGTEACADIVHQFDVVSIADGKVDFMAVLKYCSDEQRPTWFMPTLS